MNRLDRGRLLLILAGLLLLLAVVAYLINDAEDAFQRKEAAARGQEALRFHNQRSTAELKALQDERDRSTKARSELNDRQESILKSLGRIERLLEEGTPKGHGH